MLEGLRRCSVVWVVTRPVEQRRRHPDPTARGPIAPPCPLSRTGCTRAPTGHPAPLTTVVDEALAAYRFNDAAQGLYAFVWGKLCDWYVEFAKPLFTTATGIGSIALSFWAARKEFIDKNRPALVDLLEDTSAALRWYYDPANREKAVALTAGYLKRPPAAFESWLFTKRDFYRDMDVKPDLKIVQSSVDKVKELGFIKDTLEVGKYADLSLVEEAAKRRH